MGVSDMESQEPGPADLGVPDISRRTALVIRPEKDPRNWVLNWTFLCTVIGGVALMGMPAGDSIANGDWGMAIAYLAIGLLVGIPVGVVFMLVAAGILDVVVPTADMTVEEVLNSRRRKAFQATDKGAQVNQQPGIEAEPSPESPGAIQKPHMDTRS